MHYNIFKDDKTVNTVKKIKNLLKKHLNLELDEEQRIGSNNGLFSFRVTIPKTNIGTNGKGTSIINSQASGYAEFMERLQNGILLNFFNKNYSVFPDEKIYSLQDIILDNFAKIISPKLLKLGNMIVNNKLDNKFNDKFIMAPFYALKEKKTIYLPALILNSLFVGTNGMAAGNTIEEAMVQGLSELCERYAHSKIFLDNLTMPDIPDAEYKEYENINEIIKSIKNAGYEIFIKDASLGKKLPVVCIIFKDNKKNLLYINFGAHPVLPIAIERCLTEFAQGADDLNNIIKNISYENIITKTYYEYSMKENKYFLLEKMMSGLSALEINEKLEKQFLKNDISYNFSPEAWFRVDEETSNKTLLKFLINNIEAISKNEIYIRDVSFLGFPSVYIFIPRMSFYMFVDENRINTLQDLLNWYYFNEDKNSNIYNINSLMNAAEYKIHYLFPRNKNIAKKLNEYIALLCALCRKDEFKIKLYSKLLIEKDKYIKLCDEKGIKLIKIISDFYELKSKNKSEDSILKLLQKNYTNEEIKVFFHVLKTLNSKSLVECIKTKIKNTTKNSPYINNILEIKLGELYLRNIPSQEDLKEYLKFLD